MNVFASLREAMLWHMHIPIGGSNIEPEKGKENPSHYLNMRDCLCILPEVDCLDITESSSFTS